MVEGGYTACRPNGLCHGGFGRLFWKGNYYLAGTTSLLWSERMAARARGFVPVYLASSSGSVCPDGLCVWARRIRVYVGAGRLGVSSAIQQIR